MATKSPSSPNPITSNSTSPNWITRYRKPRRRWGCAFVIVLDREGLIDTGVDVLTPEVA